MKLSIRNSTAADIPAMFRISVAAHQHGYGDFIPQQHRQEFDSLYTVNPGNEANYTEVIRARLSDPSWLLWTAEIGNEIVGYTLAHRPDDATLYKRGMFVSPGAQGAGVGSALFKASTEFFKGTILLTVLQKNIRAKHIYEKNGFVVIGQESKKFFGATQDIMRRNPKTS